MIYKNIVINDGAFLEKALLKLSNNNLFKTLIVEDRSHKVVGTITDGDIRRGLISGLSNNNKISDFLPSSFVFLKKGFYNQDKIKLILSKKIQIVPVLNDDKTLFKIIDFNKVKTILPIDAVIMAGGKGVRLLPLTKTTPKPMLKIGGKPIIENNLELLKIYGITQVTISVNYLKEKIKNHLKNGSKYNLEISYVTESSALGTIAGIKKIKFFYNDYILVMNSDLLTNINLEQMFNELISNNGDIIVATKDYKVQIPYGVLESIGNKIIALKEKPLYTFFSNAGIYIFKKELIDFIPKDTYFNATDFIQKLISENKKVLNYSIKNYWLDVGSHEDFSKAQEEISYFKL